MFYYLKELKSCHFPRAPLLYVFHTFLLKHGDICAGQKS